MWRCSAWTKEQSCDLITWCDYIKPEQILKRCANDFSCWDRILVEKAWWPDVIKIMWIEKGYLGRRGMTLQSLKTYEYLGSKTKSYQSLKEFLLLFIFLSYPIRSCLSSLAFLLPLDLSLGSTQWVMPLSFAVTLMQSIAKVSDLRSVKAIE